MIQLLITLFIIKLYARNNIFNNYLHTYIIFHFWEQYFQKALNQNKLRLNKYGTRLFAENVPNILLKFNWPPGWSSEMVEHTALKVMSLILPGGAYYFRIPIDQNVPRNSPFIERVFRFLQNVHNSHEIIPNRKLRLLITIGLRIFPTMLLRRFITKFFFSVFFFFILILYCFF